MNRSGRQGKYAGTNSRTLNHYALVAFKDAYWAMQSDARAAFHAGWLAALKQNAQKVDIFQSTESGVDLLVWSAVQGGRAGGDSRFLRALCQGLQPYRH
jgi:hypothetical protein